MSKLEGIIYKAFGNYVVLRGFAPIGDIAKISKKPESYQRDADNQHKIDIINYLNDPKAYFPEVTLACRAIDYAGLIISIGSDKDISGADSQFVKGLRVLSERLPYGRDRARHAYLELDKPSNDEKLTRVDGNHRLEPFSTKLSWWHQFVNIPEEVKNEVDKEKKDGWINHQAKLFKETVSDRIIPFTIIISDFADADNFEAKIFHDINFKQLPLRQEASLRIISELEIFEDKDKLGLEYPLTIDLISKIKLGLFNDIHWLYVDSDISKTYFRTSCLRIAQLLLARKTVISHLSTKINDAVKENIRKISGISERTKASKECLDELKQKRSRIEINSTDFEKLSEYKECVIEIEKMQLELDIAENDLYQLQSEEKHLKYKSERYSNYLSVCESSSKIIEAINSLKRIYEEFEEENYGNIAMLVTMVYYALLDKAQLKSFVNWAKLNGVNKITEADDLSMDASANLIEMFEQIFQSKKNEIFISMQFGDSQSELIYEKIVRAIETFNQKHKSIYLSARPIRIDRTIESSTYSIQDKILDAIQSCSLIIADLSSSNINVYHEIGYAMGVAQSNNLLPNMILLYKENTDHNRNNGDTDKFVGFNLRNLSQLRFRDYKQLIDGLVERLEKHYGV